jgi:hypothetical protein
LQGVSAANVLGLSKQAAGVQNKILQTVASYKDFQTGTGDKEGNFLGCLRTFAETAAVALSPLHETARIVLAEYVPDSGSYDVVFGDGTGELCCAKFDHRMLLSDVIPCGKIAKEAPYHSKRFFEGYFEPIVHAVGHLVMPGDNIAVVNHPASKRRRMAAYSVKDKLFRWARFRIPETEDSWDFELEGMLSSQASMKNKQVKCIRTDLPTYYGRTGEVIDEVDRGTYKDIVVDFRRGLGVVVMTSSDIEQIP